MDCPFGSPHVLPLDQRKLAPEPIGEAWRPLSSSMGLVYLQIMGKPWEHHWENYGKTMGDNLLNQSHNGSFSPFAGRIVTGVARFSQQAVSHLRSDRWLLAESHLGQNVGLDPQGSSWIHEVSIMGKSDH